MFLGKNRKGFTLMELMVYIAILGIVVLVAGRAFSDSTKFRVRTQNMLKATDVSDRVASMISDDIAQMGAKTYKSAGDHDNPDKFSSASEVFMAPNDGDPDSSSFSLTKSPDGDSVTLRRIRYDQEEELGAVEEIAWYKRGNSVYRRCRTLTDVATSDCPKGNGFEVLITDNVDSFQVVVAKPGVTASAGVSAAERSVVLPLASAGASERSFRLLPRFDIIPGEDGTNYKILTFSPREGADFQELSDFVSNYDTSYHKPDSTGKIVHQVYVSGPGATNAVSTDSWKSLCSRVTLDSAAEYEISFEIPYSEDNSRLFCPGRDHASVGFRTVDGAKVSGLSDFLFYPPVFVREPAERSFHFSVNHKVEDVCMAFTFSSFSPSSGGRITINKLVLKKVETSNYNFEDVAYNPVTSDKQNVKAFKLHLVINQGKEVSEISQVIPTSSNGPRG